MVVRVITLPSRYFEVEISGFFFFFFGNSVMFCEADTQVRECVAEADTGERMCDV